MGISIILGALLVVITTVSNRLIGSDSRKNFPKVLQSRAVFFILVILVSMLFSFATTSSLLYGLYFGLGFWFFRQIIGPNIAFFAGHRGEGFQNGYFNDSDNEPPKWLAWLFKLFDISKWNNNPYKFGLIGGGIIGTVKSSLFILLFGLSMPIIAVLYMLFGISYGFIHKSASLISKDFRPIAEYIVGFVLSLIFVVGMLVV